MSLVEQVAGNEAYLIFWGLVVVIGLGLSSVAVITLLDIRDLLRDIRRQGTGL